MSEPDDVPTEIFNVGGVSKFDEDEKALEALVQLKELEFGEVFNDRETQLDTDKGESLSIRFYHDGKFNSLHLSSKEDSDILVRLTLADDEIPHAENVLRKLMQSLDDLTIETINIHKKYDVLFNNLHLPIREDMDYQVIGLRIEKDGREYIIQQGDDEGTSVYMQLEDPKGDTDTIVSNIGERASEVTTEFVESFN